MFLFCVIFQFIERFYGNRNSNKYHPLEITFKAQTLGLYSADTYVYTIWQWFFEAKKVQWNSKIYIFFTKSISNADQAYEAEILSIINHPNEAIELDNKLNRKRKHSVLLIAHWNNSQSRKKNKTPNNMNMRRRVTQKLSDKWHSFACDFLFVHSNVKMLCFCDIYVSGIEMFTRTLSYELHTDSKWMKKNRYVFLCLCNPVLFRLFWIYSYFFACDVIT